MTRNSPVTGYVYHAEEGQSFGFLGTRMTLKAGAETGAVFGLIEQVAPPGFAAPPHVHHAEDEAFYVLAGDVTFTCGDRALRATTGAFVFLPRGVPHHFTVEGVEPARLLQLNAPAGLEQFFVEMADPAMAPPSSTQPDLPRLLTLARKYQVELLVPDAQP